MNKKALKKLNLVNLFDDYVTINYEGILSNGRRFTAKSNFNKSTSQEKAKIEGELKSMLISQGKKVKTIKIISFT